MTIENLRHVENTSTLGPVSQISAISRNQHRRWGTALRVRTQAEEQARLDEVTTVARYASAMRVRQVAEEKQARMKSRTVSQTIQNLQRIEQSRDPAWSRLMGTIQDKRHFYQAAFSKVRQDALKELKAMEIHKSPIFARPARKTNDTLKFAERKLGPYEKMHAQLDSSLVPTSEEMLLENKLDTYIANMLEADPMKMISKNTREREARWAENGPRAR